MNKEEKELIKELERKSNLTSNNYEIFIERTDIMTILNYIDKLQKRVKIYTKLAKANLKDSQEFQDNMCNHRCIKNNEVLELKEEIYKLQKENEELKENNKSKEKQIKLMQSLNLPDEIEKYYISKDIIENKIKEYNEQREKAETKEINDMFVNYIDVLEELLGGDNND